MSFQILNSQGQSIPIDDLDKEAAEFWGLESSPILYVERFGVNWFDSIGYQIHNPETNYTSGWNNVKVSMWTIQSQRLYSDLYNDEEFNKELAGIKKFLKPFFDLIDHWKSKGYTPLKTS